VRDVFIVPYVYARITIYVFRRISTIRKPYVFMIFDSFFIVPSYRINGPLLRQTPTLWPRQHVMLMRRIFRQYREYRYDSVRCGGSKSIYFPSAFSGDKHWRNRSDYHVCSNRTFRVRFGHAFERARWEVRATTTAIVVASFYALHTRWEEFERKRGTAGRLTSTRLRKRTYKMRSLLFKVIYSLRSLLRRRYFDCIIKTFVSENHTALIQNTIRYYGRILVNNFIGNPSLKLLLVIIGEFK